MRTDAAFAALSDGSAKMPQLLLEGFRYRSATDEAKDAMRRELPRCKLRLGMLHLAPLLPDGPWTMPQEMTTALADAARHARAGSSPSPGGSPAIRFPNAFHFVWNVPHFRSLHCLSMYSPSFVVNGHA